MRWKLDKITYAALDLQWFVLSVFIFLFYPTVLFFWTHSHWYKALWLFLQNDMFMSKNWFSFHVCIIVVIQQLAWKCFPKSFFIIESCTLPVYSEFFFLNSSKIKDADWTPGVEKLKTQEVNGKISSYPHANR